VPIVDLGDIIDRMIQHFLNVQARNPYGRHHQARLVAPWRTRRVPRWMRVLR
jgi:hypothetical protein